MYKTFFFPKPTKENILVQFVSIAKEKKHQVGYITIVFERKLKNQQNYLVENCNIQIHL